MIDRFCELYSTILVLLVYNLLSGLLNALVDAFKELRAHFLNQFINLAISAQKQLRIWTLCLL